MTQLGDKCYRCGKRAEPLTYIKRPNERWHHCPRCGITFNKDTQTIEQVLAGLPGVEVARKYLARAEKSAGAKR